MYILATYIRQLTIIIYTSNNMLYIHKYKVITIYGISKYKYI